MVLMQTYFFCCSVRLGVMVVGALTMIQIIIPVSLFAAYGSSTFQPVVNLIDQNEELNENMFVKKINDWYSKEPENFMIALNIFLVSHCIWCSLAIIGAVKLYKWFLIPFILTEFFRVLSLITWHIIFMIALKRVFNLGILIVLTITGCFIILCVGYNWTTAVAFFQIINLVKTSRYKELYGDDPLAPFDSNDESSLYNTETYPNYGHVSESVEKVNVFVSPTKNETKNKLLVDGKKHQIISVIPANNVEHNKLEKQSSEFNNWHWSELVGAGRKKSNNVIGYDW